MSTTNPSADGKSWETYWQGTADVGAFSGGGVNHPAIDAFWKYYLTAVRNRFEAPRVLDIATGNGVLVDLSLRMLTIDESNITCVDISDAAIESVQQRYPGTCGIVADAASIPLGDAGFELTVSQFGVEYAGVGAVTEAARMLVPGGQLALLMHIENGIVHQECAASLAAIEALQACQFVPLARQMFAAGFAAVQGADRSAYERAATSLAPAIRTTEEVMKDYGEHVAGDTIARLYADVGRIHSRIQKYEEDDVLGWLNTMENEVAAYADRMSSMIDAALTQTTFDRVCNDLRDDGLALERAESLLIDEHQPPLAWILVASR